MWNPQERRGKHEVVTLGVNLGCKDAIYYKAVAQIMETTDICINFLTLRMMSPHHLLARFSENMLTVFYNSNRHLSAIEDLGKIAQEQSEEVIRSLLVHMKRMKNTHEVRVGNYGQHRVTYDVVPDVCQGWRNGIPGHFNPHSWPPFVSDVKKFTCPTCQALAMVHIFCDLDLECIRTL